MAITFDRINKLIVVGSPTTTVTVQELLNEIRDFEDELDNMDLAQIAFASGKDDLGGGDSVGITLNIKDDWRVQFEARNGPEFTLCTIRGGNTLAENIYSNSPVKSSAFTAVVIAQSSSPTIAGGIESDVTDLHDEAFGRWNLDASNAKLVLYRVSGATLASFDLTATSGTIEPYLDRTPV
ncbi:MAG: hypothetical protein ACW99G_19190 [Candidatus Thorarchaeota archaeon]|jgi:hypothetical protein